MIRVILLLWEVQMINIALVEDNSAERKELINFINSYFNGKELGFKITEFNDGLAFLNDKLSFNIIFMDIEMPMINGMDTARRLRQKDSLAVLIFVTKVAELAVEGYSVEAIDYLIKPLNYQAFRRTMDRAMAQNERNIKNDIITIKTSDNGTYRVDCKDIIYFEVFNHKITYYLSNKTLQSWGTLKEVKAQFPDYFFLINKSVVININYVKSVDKDCIQMLFGESLLLSRMHKKEFMIKVATTFNGK